MKLKFCLLFLLFLPIYIIAQTTFIAEAISPRPVLGGEVQNANILLSEVPIETQNPTLVINGVVMIPTRTFFDKLNAQVYWIEDSSEFIVYKDNTFLKFTVGSPTSYMNGLPFELPVRCFFYRGTLYVPLDVVANAFDLNYTYSKTEGLVHLDYKEGLYQFKQIGYQYYKRINMTNWGISFYMPEMWLPLEGDSSRYGFKTPYEDYELQVNLIALDPGSNRTLFMEAYKTSLQAEYGPNLTLIDAKTFQPGKYVISALYYSILEGTDLIYNAFYVINENNIAYVFKGVYSELNDLNDSKMLFDTIIESFLINKLAINEAQEHYIELNPFFDYDVQMNTRIFSNMRIENEISVDGKLKGNNAIKGLYVAVTKDTNRMDYYIPVIDNAFKASIYTPFGLGKHNVSISIDKGGFFDPLPESATESSLDAYINKAITHDFSLDSPNTMLKFSVINTSNETIKDLLPSEFINYDTPSVYAVNNRITYNLTSQYAKARALYDWIYSSYNFTKIPFIGEILSVDALINLNEGNAFELCVLYTGLLRSNDIPARIVRGVSETSIDYWVETYINGKWLIADIAKEVEEKTSEPLRYFNVSRNGHYEKYTAIDTLPF